MTETAVILQSTLTCPHCGTAKTETMPTNACLFFYECTGCGKLLRPNAGDCCVFCSFNRNRRLAKDFEATIQSAVTWLYIASVKLNRAGFAGGSNS